MSDTDTPTTSETILASAGGETDPKALSAAAETTLPLDKDGHPYDPTHGNFDPSAGSGWEEDANRLLIESKASGDALFPSYQIDGAGKLVPVGATSQEPGADHETRLQRLEDELAFLRKMFGWPENTH